MRRQHDEGELRVRFAASELDLAGMTITAPAIYAKVEGTIAADHADVLVSLKPTLA